MSSPATSDYLEPGTPEYHRAHLAMFFGGFACFAMLYSTQPILPLLSQHFGVSPASASLSVSASTAGLALCMIPASLLADRYGRVALMKVSLTLAALISVAVAWVGDFTHLLLLRGLLGAILAGMPAVAMAYLGEEIAPHAQGRAMGLYIAGNALGGMSGRFITAAVTEWTSWRWGLTTIGVIGCLAALVFCHGLPASRHFRARPIALGAVGRDLVRIVRDPGLPQLFVCGFLLMGSFVGLYNYLGFHLMEAPFNLSQTAIGSIFLLYVLGTWASTWGGKLSDRIGRRHVLWGMSGAMVLGLALTLAPQLPVLILGVALFTFGFFGAHSTASGWVGRRAGERRALASAMYLFFYYVGSSTLGSLSGLAWGWKHWPGVALILGLAVALSLATALHLRRLPPVAKPATGTVAA